MLDQPVICDSVGPVPEGPWMKELRAKNIVIIDTEDSGGPIEVLIGADIAATILSGKQEKLACGILAIETLLGWTVLGKPSLFEDTENFALLITNLLIKDASIKDRSNLELISKMDSPTMTSKKRKSQLLKSDFDADSKRTEKNTVYGTRAIGELRETNCKLSRKSYRESRTSDSFEFLDRYSLKDVHGSCPDQKKRFSYRNETC